VSTPSRCVLPQRNERTGGACTGPLADLFHLQPRVRIERRQIVEIDLMTGLFGILEIKRIHFEQRKVALAFFGAANVAVDGIARAQAEAADLRRRDVEAPWR
jgi:hypothetical protein